jgi:DNA-binding NtrC family response regulator
MKTLLVLEHHPANLIALAMILRAYGYVALEASSREEALSICRDYPTGIDVLIAGIASPIQDVRELECCLKLLHPKMHVLLLCDSAKDAGAAGEKPLPCWTLLRRPLEPDTLDRSIRKLLGHPQTNVAARSL